MQAYTGKFAELLVETRTVDFGIVETNDWPYAWEITFRCGCSWRESQEIDARVVANDGPALWLRSGWVWQKSCRQHRQMKRDSVALRTAIKRSRHDTHERRVARAGVMIMLGWSDHRIRDWTRLGWIEIETLRFKRKAAVVNYDRVHEMPSSTTLRKLLEATSWLTLDALGRRLVIAAAAQVCL